MVDETKYYSEVVTKNVNKKFVLTRKDNEEFWICDNVSVDVNVKSRDYCHITEKYRRPSHRYCNTKHRSNDKIPVLFYNHKNYDSHLIMKEL